MVPDAVGNWATIVALADGTGGRVHVVGVYVIDVKL